MDEQKWIMGAPVLFFHMLSGGQPSRCFSFQLLPVWELHRLALLRVRLACGRSCRATAKGSQSSLLAELS